jgi:hypothetical protein
MADDFNDLSRTPQSLRSVIERIISGELDIRNDLRTALKNADV